MKNWKNWKNRQDTSSRMDSPKLLIFSCISCCKKSSQGTKGIGNVGICLLEILQNSLQLVVFHVSCALLKTFLQGVVMLLLDQSKNTSGGHKCESCPLGHACAPATSLNAVKSSECDFCLYTVPIVERHNFQS